MQDNEKQGSIKAPLAPEDAEKADSKRKKKEKQKRRRQNKAMKKKQRKQALPRSERLKIAPKWLAEYDTAVHGKNIIKAYRKHFHIEPQCALQELKILNYPLTEEQIRKFHEAEHNKVTQERNKKRKRRERLEAAREARRLKKEGFSAQRCQGSSPQRLHDDHRNASLRKELVLSFRVLLLPIQIVELNLCKIPCITIQQGLQDRRYVVERKAQLFDFPLLL